MTHRLWPYGAPITSEHTLPRPARPRIATWHVLATCLRRGWAWLRLLRVDARLEAKEVEQWKADRAAQRAERGGRPNDADRHAARAQQLEGKIAGLRREQGELEREVGR